MSAMKLLMTWDINRSTEAEYYEFIVNEFIPRLKRLGLNDLQFWYTTYGDCEQIQASGITNTRQQMDNILTSDDWTTLQQRLVEYVSRYRRKVVVAVGGFQL